MEKKFAVFTDVHGLQEPLEAILSDIKSKDISEIYSLGDNIGLGPNSVQVIELLERNNVISVAGNYEDMLTLGCEPFMKYLTKEKIDDITQIKKHLSKGQIDFVKSFPHFININNHSVNMALCHFANDVRIDYWHRSCHSYSYSMNNDDIGYLQFLYTNSHEQLIEIASNLGMDLEDLFSEKDNNFLYYFITLYVKENQRKLNKSPNISGFVSYIKDPLFTEDGELKSAMDYNTILQGHNHFALEEHTYGPTIHTFRSAGMGYDDNEQEDYARYYIITVNENGYSIAPVDVKFDRNRMIKKVLDSNCETMAKYTRARIR